MFFKEPACIIVYFKSFWSCSVDIFKIFVVNVSNYYLSVSFLVSLGIFYPFFIICIFELFLFFVKHSSSSNKKAPAIFLANISKYSSKSVYFLTMLLEILSRGILQLVIRIVSFMLCDNCYSPHALFL